MTCGISYIMLFQSGTGQYILYLIIFLARLTAVMIASGYLNAQVHPKNKKFKLLPIIVIKRQTVPNIYTEGPKVSVSAHTKVGSTSADTLIFIDRVA